MGADINEIAMRCGVSKATVSRVFTNRARVSNSVRESVLSAARELNYTPKQAAAREVITIVVDNIDRLEDSDNFFSTLLVSLVAEITRSRYTVNISEARYADAIVGSQTRLVVSLLNEPQFTLWQDKMETIEVPIVSVNNNPISWGHVVATDYKAEIVMAIDYLVSQGHRDIFLFQDNASIWAGQERYQGYVEGLSAHGLETMPSLSYYSSEAPMVEQIASMLRHKPQAAIFCGESFPAEVAFALHLLKVRVPDDLSVITYEKLRTSRWLIPPHTTIDQNIPHLVRETLKVIREISESQPSPRLIKRLKSRLVIRDSVKNLNRLLPL